LWLFLGLAFTGVLRRLNRWCYQGLLYWRLYKPKRVVLLGHGPWAEQLKKNLSDKSLFNFLTCLGWFTIEQTADEATLAKGCLGHWLQLPGYLEQARAQRLPVDEIVLAFPATETQTLSQILNILEDEVVDIRVVPDFTPYIRLCGAMQDFLGFPSMLVQTTPLYGFARLMKRLCDVLISGILLILLFPLFLVLACCVFVSDPGPIFYGQERVGLDQLPFKMWKFRTMRIDAESSGAQMAKDDWDPRCTWIGHYLRRFSLDELPQLWHVFCGEMSLVGPRPERPIFIQRFKQEIPRYLLRHKMKSGMTGWAQVNGWRGNTDMFKRIEMDLYYIENWSLTFDLKILLKTLCGGFISRASSAKMAPCPRRLT
jgi:exopolysaccharide biosynthesis polyprenyl glycosylphosphotransferase